jgi:glycosyltransferase involved in cell wall biosynthesis
VKFLILTQYFPPEIGGAQTRLHAFAQELRRQGHDVEVVTALANYPRGKFLPGHEGRYYLREVRNGIVVHRVWLYPSMGRGLRRMVNYLSFSLTCLYGLLRAGRPDVLFVESPPLCTCLPAFLMALLWNRPWILNISDLWPDALAEGGFFQPGPLLSFLYALERWAYRRADYVSAVTEGIQHTLLKKKSLPADKVLFLPNGVDISLFHPQPADLALRQSLGLAGKKIILWAGTLGLYQGLDHVLQSAKMLESQPEIHFLFVGDGSARPRLEKLREELGLDNVSFHDPVPLEELPRFLSIAECGLASLTALPLHDGARPSKLLPVMASGKPVLFVGQGDCARLIQSAGAGVAVTPENPTALAEAVLALFGDPDRMTEFGENGRRFVEENYQWSHLVETWLRDITATRVSTGARAAARGI